MKNKNEYLTFKQRTETNKNTMGVHLGSITINYDLFQKKFNVDKKYTNLPEIKSLIKENNKIKIKYFY